MNVHYTIQAERPVGENEASEYGLFDDINVAIWTAERHHPADTYLLVHRYEDNQKVCTYRWMNRLVMESA